MNKTTLTLTHDEIEILHQSIMQQLTWYKRKILKKPADIYSINSLENILTEIAKKVKTND